MDGLPEQLDQADEEGRPRWPRRSEVDVWVGLDVGKEEHFAEVLDDAGERLFARGVVNDQAALEALLDRAAEHGTPGW